jgi:hypothetical protein
MFIDPVSIGLEIAAIVAGADSAVKTVKKAIQVGKDIHSVSNEIMGFLNGTAELAVLKVKVEAAATDPDSEVNLTSIAFDIVLKEKKLREDEEYLRNMVIYELDQVDVWFAMVRKRDELYKQKAAAHQAKLTEARLKLKLAEEKIAKRRAKIKNIIETTITVILGVGSIVFLVWGFMWVVFNWRY